MKTHSFEMLFTSLKLYQLIFSKKKVYTLNKFIKSISNNKSNEIVPKYLNYGKRVAIIHISLRLDCLLYVYCD